MNARPAGVSGSGGEGVREGRPARARPRGAPDGVGAGREDTAGPVSAPQLQTLPDRKLANRNLAPRAHIRLGAALSSGRAAGGRCPASLRGQVRLGSPQTTLFTQDTGSGRGGLAVQAAGCRRSARTLPPGTPGLRRWHLQADGDGQGRGSPSSWVGMLDARWLYFVSF